MIPEIFKKFPVTAGGLALVSVFIVQSLFSGNSMITNAMIQTNWCIATDSICLLTKYVSAAVTILLICIISDFLISRYRKRKVSRKTKIKKIKITSKQEISRNQKNTRYAYLEIFNGENNDLTNCYVTFDKLYAKTGNGWLTVFEHINPNISNFSWPIFKPENQKVIYSKRSARVNIAKTIFDEISFTLEDGDHLGLASWATGTYYFEMELNGILNGVSIQGIRFTGFIYNISKPILEPDRPPKVETSFYIEKGFLAEKDRQN